MRQLVLTTNAEGQPAFVWDPATDAFLAGFTTTTDDTDLALTAR